MIRGILVRTRSDRFALCISERFDFQSQHLHQQALRCDRNPAHQLRERRFIPLSLQGFSTIPGGAGFLPSTVWEAFLGMVFPQFLFPLHGVSRWVEVRQMIPDDLIIQRIYLPKGKPQKFSCHRYAPPSCSIRKYIYIYPKYIYIICAKDIHKYHKYATTFKKKLRESHSLQPFCALGMLSKLP